MLTPEQELRALCQMLGVYCTAPVTLLLRNLFGDQHPVFGVVIMTNGKLPGIRDDVDDSKYQRSPTLLFFYTIESALAALRSLPCQPKQS